MTDDVQSAAEDAQTPDEDTKPSPRMKQRMK